MSVPNNNNVLAPFSFTHTKQVKPVCIAKGDSAASQHYWRERDVDVLPTIYEEPGPPVTLPNSNTINDNKVGHIPLGPSISKKGSKARILKALKSANLVLYVAFGTEESQGHCQVCCARHGTLMT